MKIFETQWYIRISDKTKPNYYKIIARDFLKFDKTFDTVTSGSESTDYTVTELEPPENELYVFTIGLYNDVKVMLKQPPAISKWGCKGSPMGQITMEESPAEDPSPKTMVAAIKGFPIILRFRNDADVDLAPKVKFIGFKYKISPVTEPEKIAELETKWKEGKLPEIKFEYK